MLLWIILAVVVIIALWLIGVFNGLVKLRVRVKEAWSDIEVQLKRRYNLIPNLVETVKGYAKHEDKVFTEVTEARSKAMQAKGPEDAAKAEGAIKEALKSLFAVSENYPDLKASQNFLELQEELSDTENKIQASRRFYNGNVRDFNTKQSVFPSNIVASIFNFKKAEFFELEEEEARKPVKVDFNK